MMDVAKSASPRQQHLARTKSAPIRRKCDVIRHFFRHCISCPVNEVALVCRYPSDSLGSRTIGGTSELNAWPASLFRVRVLGAEKTKHSRAGFATTPGLDLWATAPSTPPPDRTETDQFRESTMNTLGELGTVLECSMADLMTTSRTPQLNTAEAFTQI